MEAPDELYEALRAWSVYMHTKAQYSKSTIKGKLQEATRLTAWLADQDLISTREITAELVSAYAVEKYGHLGDRTHNLYISHLRIYLDFLRKKRLLGEDQSPESELIARRRPESTRVKTFIYPEDVADLAEKAGEWHDRDKYFLLFAFYMTRRAGEVTALRWRDIDLTQRKGYPFGMFKFKNNKIGGDQKKRAIDPILRPYVIEWQERFQELLNERYGLNEKGKPERPMKPDDYVFPPIEAAGGLVVKGARMPLQIVPGVQLSYFSIRNSLRRAGVLGVHSARRGGMISLDERFGLEAARIMADHASLAQAAEYMDKDRQAESVGDLFAKEQERKTKKAVKKARKAAAKAGLTNLKDRRAGARRAS